MFQYFLAFIFLISLSNETIKPCYRKHVVKHVEEKLSKKFEKPIQHQRMLNPMNLPDEFDLRKKTVLSPVQNQNMPGFCSACWAFAAASTITDRIYMSPQYKIAVPFYISVQDIISCYGIGSCKDGGNSYYVYVHALNNKLTDDTCSPYLAKDEACKSLKRCIVCTSEENCVSLTKYNNYTVSGFGTLYSELSMMDEIHRNGPISCSIHATHKFLTEYKGGIYLEELSGEVEPNYEISVIGWGEETTKEGEKIPFWIARNSLGTSWGENGFFRVPRSKYRNDKFSLGIEKDCSYPAGLNANYSRSDKSKRSESPIIESEH